jgi:hypothetical protein
MGQNPFLLNTIQMVHIPTGLRLPVRGAVGRRSTSPGYQLLNLNRFVFKGFVFLGSSCQEKGIRLLCNTIGNSRNNVGAAKPVCFGKICL